MNILINFGILLVTALASLWAALAGVFMVGGKDIGFAGGGWWLIAGPAAPVAMLIGLGVAWLSGKTPGTRRGLFFGVSCAAGFFLGAIGLAVLTRFLVTPMPTWTYIPAKNYSATLEIVSVPAELVAGEPFKTMVTMKHGPWEKVRYKELRRSEYAGRAQNSTTPEPPPVDTTAARLVFWRLEPGTGDMHPAVEQLVPPGDAYNMVIERPGTYRLFAEVLSPAMAKSNVVTITVRPK